MNQSKNFLIKGDAKPAYGYKKIPHHYIQLIFHMDIYAPTKKVLEQIIPGS